MLKLTIPMRPVSKARPRVVNGHAYTPEKTRAAEQAIALAVKAHMSKSGITIATGAVCMAVEFSFKLPASATKRDRELLKEGKLQHIRRPDTDNLTKLVSDSLNSIAFNDDSQIVELHAFKVFGNEDYIKIELKEI